MYIYNFIDCFEERCEDVIYICTWSLDEPIDCGKFSVKVSEQERFLIYPCLILSIVDDKIQNCEKWSLTLVNLTFFGNL